VPTTRQGTTDISIFPDSMVERVEVVTGGASAAYGTDAVAGVTNFILDTRYEGFKGHVQAGETSRGDSDNWESSFGFGTAIGERAHIIASVDYAKSDALQSWDDREWFQDWGVVTNPAFPASGPQLLTRPNVTSTLYTLGGLINQPGSALHRQMFLPDGSITPFVLGSPAIVNGGTNSHQGEGANIQRDRGLFGVFPSTDRYNVFGHFTYDVSDSLELTAQVLRGRNDVTGNGFPSVLFGPWQARIFQDNAFLSDQVRQIMINENLQSFGFSRMGSTEDTTVSDILQRNTFDSYTFGFEKTLNDWRIDGYFQYGRNDGLLDIRHWIRTSHLFPAMDAVRHPTTGEIVCNRTLYDPSFHCVPINLLGSGRASPEAVAFVTDAIKAAHTVNRQRVFEVSADGEIFEGWAGPISLAFGAAYREDTLSQIVDDPTNPARQ
jgi:iron complex outermembrane recepter protein